MKLSDLFTPEELFRAITADDSQISPERSRYFDQIVKENRAYLDALRPCMGPGGFSEEAISLVGGILCTIDIILRERTVQ